MTTKTKQLIPNKSWLVENDGKKIGTLYKEASGFSFYQNGKKLILDGTMVDIINDLDANLQQPKSNDKKFIYGFPTSSSAHNPIYNVHQKLPMYTTTKKSKCYICAGYYLIKINDEWIQEFCPKFLKIRRSEYFGPFESTTHMQEKLSIINNETN